MLDDLEERETGGDRSAVAARFEADLDVEEAALDVEVAELLNQVPGGEIRLFVEGQRAGERGHVVALVAVEARDEERAGVDADAQRDDTADARTTSWLTSALW